MTAGLDKNSYAPFEKKMERSLAVLQEHLNAVRAGRANPRVLDRITVEYYGTETPLNQVAGIQVPEPRMITIQPWEASLLPAIEKAILASDLGLTPANDGKIIRLAFPALTEDRRKDLVKQVEKYGEECKIAIRNVRRECLDMVKNKLKSKEISEDQQRAADQDIQKLTDRYTGKVDKMVADKEKDLMEI